jgi:membrane-associated phospholipid phosphatase
MRQVFMAWTLCLGILAGGALLVCPGERCIASNFDHAGLSLAHELRGVTLDRLMSGITWLGSLALLLPLAGLLAWILSGRGRRHEAGFVLLALLGSSVLSHVTKLWLMRPRPDLFPAVSAMPGDWSYPSAHSMQISAAALALFLVAGQRRAFPLAVMLLVVVLMVGLSRIYLQVHFPSDVLAGLFAGALWVCGLHALLPSRGIQEDKGRATGGAA